MGYLISHKGVETCLSRIFLVDGFQLKRENV